MSKFEDWLSISFIEGRFCGSFLFSSSNPQPTSEINLFESPFSSILEGKLILYFECNYLEKLLEFFFSSALGTGVWDC